MQEMLFKYKLLTSNNNSNPFLCNRVRGLDYMRTTTTCISADMDFHSFDLIVSVDGFVLLHVSS